jgi:hypothetical protein
VTNLQQGNSPAARAWIAQLPPEYRLAMAASTDMDPASAVDLGVQTGRVRHLMGFKPSGGGALQEDDHPRWPAEDPQGRGGEFAPKGGAQDGRGSMADSLGSLFDFGQSSNSALLAAATRGFSNNSGLPFRDPMLRSGARLAARLLGGVAEGALFLFDASPTNSGETEYLASRMPGPYRTLNSILPSGFQVNHLNQNAAYQDVIPSGEGISIGMEGNAITQPGTPHYLFHQSLERFWDRYRRGGPLWGEVPTNAQYGQALQQALEASGLSPGDASYLAQRAAEQRVAYGLRGSGPVPRVPGRTNQVQP